LMGSSHAHGSDPTGPHSSHMANKADPRVDSDRYGAAGNTAGAGGVGAGQYGSNTSHTGTHGTSGGLMGSSHNTHGTAGGLGQSHATSHGDPSGPHSSSLANKLDPTVDTKSYGTANPATGHYSGNTHGTTGGLTGSHGTTGYSDPTGPHKSHMANQADPRVDSDRYGAAGNTSGAGGYGAGQYGSTGSGLTGGHGTHTGTTGSGLTGTHGHTGTVGSGNSNTTAGPHNSDMLNKIDPRVDSDLDGSKTYGGNQTYH
jgi:hypothetical protein